MILASLFGFMLTAALLVLLLRHRPTPHELDLPWPYRPLPIMTNSEVRLYQLLKDALPDAMILTQVQISRLVEVPIDELGGAASARWRSRVAQLSADYVLVDADCRTVLAVIELDDWSHEAAHRVKTDAKKDEALSAAGLPVMRFHGEQMPDADLIRSATIDALKRWLRFERGRYLAPDGWAASLVEAVRGRS